MTSSLENIRKVHNFLKWHLLIALLAVYIMARNNASQTYLSCMSSEAEFLNEIQTKVFRVFHPAIHSHRYSFALRYLFLQTHATSYSFYNALLYTIKEERGKPDRKPQSLSYGLRNPYVNLKSKNSQDYAQKSQRNCTFINLASGQAARVQCILCLSNKLRLIHKNNIFFGFILLFSTMYIRLPMCEKSRFSMH